MEFKNHRKRRGRAFDLVTAVSPCSAIFRFEWKFVVSRGFRWKFLGFHGKISRRPRWAPAVMHGVHNLKYRTRSGATNYFRFSYPGAARCVVCGRNSETRGSGLGKLEAANASDLCFRSRRISGYTFRLAAPATNWLASVNLCARAINRNCKLSDD